MSEPKKVNLESKNITEETLEELKRLMPSVFKEGKIDFDALKAVLGDVVEPSREFYNFTWAGKSEAFRTLQRPSTATLKPCEEESKEWDTTENLFIEGDNLEVLKLLQKTYHNSIKMIYIDPPYNKDKDFVYPDRWSEGIKSYKEFCGFVDSDGNITTSEDEAKNVAGRKHSRWLTMMYPRLFLARNLLKEDGVMFVSIDNDELKNLRAICDEIFGEDCVETFVWYLNDATEGSFVKTPSNTVRNEHEYILACFKNSDYKAFGKYPDFRYKDNEGFSNPDNDPRGNWMSGNISRNGITSTTGSKYFTITTPTGVEYSRNWTLSKDEFDSLLKDNRIYFSNNGNGVPRVKIFQNEPQYNTQSSIFQNLKSSSTGKKEVSGFFDGIELFSFPKPVDLIKRMLLIANTSNSIILDFFAGSGTTANAVMALNAEDGGNRKYICVQIPEPTPEDSEAKKAGYKSIAEISKERIRRAGEKVKADNPLFAGDIGFKVFKLDESNFKQWDKEVADAEMLKQQIMEFADNVSPEASKANMLYELLLKKGYSLNVKVEKKQIADNEIFVVDDSMLVCLDDKISSLTIDEVIKLRPAHFIVLDRAFEGNDQLKTNTWQTFKSLFPNDENPFETV